MSEYFGVHKRVQNQLNFISFGFMEEMEDQKHAGGRPRLFESPEKLQAAIDEYFSPTVDIYVETKVGLMQAAKKQELRSNPTITGLAYHLGFESRQSFYDYETIEEFSYIIKRARLRVEIGYESRLAENNVAGAIFALKNMGWKDKTETELSGELAVKQITGMTVT